MPTFANVRKIALALKDVEEGLSYGTPAFKVDGALIVRHRPEVNSIALRMSFEDRDELIAEDPKTYYITDHYLNYEWVLVRLTVVRLDALKDLIFRAWKSAVEHQKKCGNKKSGCKKKSQHSKE
jgi:hypothetical protein